MTDIKTTMDRQQLELEIETILRRTSYSQNRDVIRCRVARSVPELAEYITKKIADKETDRG